MTWLVWVRWYEDSLIYFDENGSSAHGLANIAAASQLEQLPAVVN